ncbi:hypothetical protein KIH74_25410 [Kineosporia sp. J2-2]|uniref:WXG100 family type VII secretion target n=1 Tax=Kineosporia corallincola TaxID=2835133 RepID=A0ABS5TMH6_9ACTN|nr:hypothetical protein [Kineosporia corallincola]MBT0772308.1 hypothetical protein [Kineosporia corallincola]
MTDINVDPTAIATTKTVISDNIDTCVADLKSLLAAVQTLLTSDGGLWLKTSSPVMSEQFTKFATDLQDGISKIQTFADTFQSILDNLNELDVGYSATS